MSAQMKGITCCGDCVYYDWKKHRCKRCQSVETDPRKHFYDDCPLPEAAEVRAGKWERHYSRPGVYADLYWWCSSCGKPTSYQDAGIFYRYCPQCGAKMEFCRDD